MSRRKQQTNEQTTMEHKNLNNQEASQSIQTDVSGRDTITLTRDELSTFLQDWSAGYSAEELSLTWDERSLRIVNFLGLDE